MPFITPKAWLVLPALLLAALLQPAQATVVYEADTVSRMDASSSHVQIIEGDQNLQPPLPPASSSQPAGKIYLSVATIAPPVFPQGSPAVTQAEELGAMMVRYNKALDPSLADQMSQAIQAYSNIYNVDPRLITSVIAVESSFRPNAISSSGAIGLGQLKPDTAKWLGVLDPFDPIQNVSGVAKYLHYLLSHYNGNTSLALAAYYKGQGSIDKGSVDDNTIHYVNKISQVFSRYF